MKMINLCLAVLLVTACTQQQTRDSLHRFPYDFAKSACKGSSSCEVTEPDKPRGGAEPAPDHWYEDGYGRDERAPRR